MVLTFSCAPFPRQSHCRDRWLARLQLRDVMQRSYRDYKMLDWVLTQVRTVWEGYLR